MADITESPKLLTSVIKELQDNNHVNELIFDSVETLNTSLTTDIQGEYNTDIFTQILDRINGIYKNIFKFLDIFAGNDLQDEENRRELLAALRGIGKKQREERTTSPQTEKTAEGLSGLLSTLLIGGAGFLIGTVSGFIGQISSMISAVIKDSKIFRAVSNFTNKLGSGIVKFIKDSKLYTAISDFVSGIGTRMSGFFLKIKDFFNIKLSGVQSVLGKSKILSGITSRISAFFSPLIELFKFIKGVLPAGGPSIFSKLMIPLKGIGETFKAMSVTFTKAIGIGKVFGQILGKLALPITIIMGLWDTIKGAMAGYKEDGIMGAVKGGISGLLNSLVGSMLDLFKDGIAWLAGKFGFKGIEEKLNSFSFSEIITSLVTGITDFLSSIFNLVLAPFVTIPKMIRAAVNAISTDGFKGIFEFPKIILKEVLPDPNKHKSGFDPLYWTAKAIPDSIYEYAGVNKPEMKANVVTETTGAVSSAIKANTTAKERLQALDKAKGYDLDEDGVLSDSEFVNQLKGEKISGDLGDIKLDYSTPEFAKRSDELLQKSNITTGVEIPTPLTPSVERPQNNTGATLNQSSQSTLAMPVIVNNYGGNITNNTTSRVNNTQAIYDPIVTGSNLSLTNR
jgi:hypothetical protein